MRLILAFLIAFTMPSLSFSAENEEKQKLLTAVSHCVLIANNLPQLHRVINAFNHQPKPEDFVKQMSEEEKAEFVLYLKSRPDIPNFSFILAQFLSRASRDQSIKFNAIITLIIAEKLGFNIRKIPSRDNCKVIAYQGDIIKTKLQYGDQIKQLDYIIKSQKNYGFYIDDIILNNVSIKFFFKEKLENYAYKNGLDSAINHLCKQSVFSTLKCL